MPKVLFTETRIVRDQFVGTPKETRYEAGQVYDLRQDSVDRWVKRGVATADADKIAAVDRAEAQRMVKSKVSAAPEAVQAPAPDTASVTAKPAMAGPRFPAVPGAVAKADVSGAASDSKDAAKS